MNERERLIIPNNQELDLAFQSMRGRTERAAARGERAEKPGDIGYANAKRYLEENPHLAEHLQELADRLQMGADTIGLEAMKLTVSEVFMHGAKHVLEVMSVATTYDQLPDIDDPTA